MKQRYLANPDVAPRDEADGTRFNRYEDLHDPFYPRFWEDRLNEPRHLGGGQFGMATIPKGIFTVDMGELFGEWIPREWQDKIFDVIRACPQHRFYLLTKQPQNLIKWSPFPSNCFVGVTATNQDMYDSAVYHLGRIQARIRYISLEPLLSPIHLPNYKDVDWLILGGKSGKDKFYPPEDWIQKIEAVIDRLGISTFIFEKLNLRKTWDKPPRQELP